MFLFYNLLKNLYTLQFNVIHMLNGFTKGLQKVYSALHLQHKCVVAGGGEVVGCVQDPLRGPITFVVAL